MLLFWVKKREGDIRHRICVKNLSPSFYNERMYRLIIFCFCCLFVPVGNAMAADGTPGTPDQKLAAQEEEELIIKIRRGVTRPITLALVPFRVSGAGADTRDQIVRLIRNDFRFSGHLTGIAENDLPSSPFRVNQILYKEWRDKDIEYLIFGELSKAGRRTHRLNITIMDVFAEEALSNDAFTFPSKYTQDFAHYVSDYIYEKMLGIQGSFSTKIVFVRVSDQRGKREYSLNIADADGKRERLILRSDEPITSPAWSPDAKKIAYVSFEHGRSNIYVQDIRSGKRWLVTAFRGINSAPAWSPDGRQLAVVLSRGANADIYLIDLDSLKVRRLTRHPGIDTEPAWSREGTKLVFTSDRINNKPQIFQYDLNNNAIKRLTFDNVYTSSAEYTHGDSALVLISRAGGGYRVTKMDLAKRVLQAITKNQLDDSPSVSPDGNRVIYSTRRGGSYRLAIASVDLGNPVYLPLGGGTVKSPDWSPFLYRFKF